MERSATTMLLCGLLITALVPASVLLVGPAVADHVDVLPASSSEETGTTASSTSDSPSHPAQGSDATSGFRDHRHATDRPRFDWTLEEGSVPTRQEAESSFDVFHDLVIESNSGFAPSNGVASGSGTADDPFVIEHVLVRDDLYIADTDAYVVIRESWIDGQLTLNWVGDKVYVHHNHIADLRVNENVPRTGYDTVGLFEHNEIEYVGQIRHADGVFRFNTVGPRQGFYEEVLDQEPPVELPWSDEKVMQLDGMNGGDFYGNAFFGLVEIKLHGHHHSSCYGCPSHDHANESAAAGPDHTVRYHGMQFHDNTLHVDAGPALRYTDTNHDGDDTQAASEDVEALNLPHVHHTKVFLRDNVLDGGGLYVDVFNAEDEDHEQPNPGTLVIEGNEITLREPDEEDVLQRLFQHRLLDGIQVDRVKTLDLEVRGNTVTFEGEYTEPDDGFPTGWLTSWIEDGVPVGIRLVDGRTTNATIEGNTIEGTHYGVKASDLDASVSWVLEGNTFQGVAEEVYWDESVERQPRRG